jgi:hypothetical protein
MSINRINIFSVFLGSSIKFLAFCITGLLVLSSVHAQSEAELIDEGFRLWTEETWDGNGRTCGTCHIPSENYNIFPKTVKKMNRKERELLFATSVPGLENAALIQSHALFNISGGATVCAADTPGCWVAGEEHNGQPVFRSSMTIQALALTSIPATSYPGTPLAPIVCSQGGIAATLPQLGWAGDGAPGTPDISDECSSHHGSTNVNADGSFRAFAWGAIAQHSTKGLSRTPGPGGDFRFATDDELDAMEIFQLWLGRRPLTAAENAIQSTVNANEFDIRLLAFKDARVALGRDHYVGAAEFAPPPGPPGGGPPPPPVLNPDSGAGCNVCHVNAGARAGFPGPPATGGGNINLNTDVEKGSHDIGMSVIGTALPHDVGGSNSFGPPVNSFDDTFNIQSIIEAADKKAWFHNHRVIENFEEAITFYTTEDFTDGAAAFTTLNAMQVGNASGSISFPKGNGINHLGAFLRSLSAFYQLRDCERLIDEAIDRIGAGMSHKNPVNHCRFNLKDTRRILKEAKLKKVYKHVAKGVKKVEKALKKVSKKGKHKKLVKELKKARNSIRYMRDLIAVQTPPA